MMTLSTERKLEQTIKNLMKELEKHQKEWGYTVDEIVVGMPLMMDGTQGLIADEVKLFVDLLSKEIQVQIKTWDERLTSVQAERFLKGASMSRKKRTKVVDKVSAVIILQSYLDSKSLDIPPIP